MASSRASSAVSGPATTSSSLAAAPGVVVGEPRQRIDERARVAPVAAEAPGVDQGGPGRVEQAGRRVAVRGRQLGVPAVADQQRLGDPPRAQVLGGRRRDARHHVGGGEPAALEPAIQPSLGRGRKLGPQGLEGPRVADVGHPGHAAAGERHAHAVRGLRRRGRDHAVEVALAMQAQGPMARERRPGQRQRLGDDQPAQRVGPAGVGVGVVQGVDPIPAVQPGPPALRVRGPDRLLVAADSVRRGRQDNDPVAEAPQPFGHRRGAQRARVTARRVEVGDEQDRAAHRRSLLLRAAIAPS